MKILLALPLLFMLGACSPVGQAAVGGAIGEIKGFNDAAAQVTMQTQCAIPYGTVVRMPAHQRLSVKLNCDPAALEQFMGRIIQ